MTVEQVTVFGGTGFVGSRIVQQLSAEGKQVRVAVRHPKIGTQKDAGAGAATPAQIYADVCDSVSVVQAIEGSQAVINVVSLYVERGDAAFDAVHVRGAQNVAEAAQRAGIERLVHFSGLGVDPDSRSSYVRARAQGEATVRKAFPEATILRPSVIFGPGDSFFNTLARITRFVPVLPLFGNGETLLQPVFVEDVAKAVVTAMSEPSAPGKIYELGGPKVYSYKTLVKLLLDHLDRKRFLIPVPLMIWECEAALLNVLPEPPLTRDQVILMERDNVVSSAALTISDLGFEATPVESELASCLH